VSFSFWLLLSLPSTFTVTMKRDPSQLLLCQVFDSPRMGVGAPPYTKADRTGYYLIGLKLID
jgi:hypothetical protein